MIAQETALESEETIQLSQIDNTSCNASNSFQGVVLTDQNHTIADAGETHLCKQI